jgi:pyruvate-formate lyase
MIQAETLIRCVEAMPLSIPEGTAIAGSMDAAFSPSYALINPTFKIESFAGYCDPVAVYDDISPEGEITRERIDAVVVLARRYADLAAKLLEDRKGDPGEHVRLELIERSCRKVPFQGASNLHEAMQSYVLLWQAMCLKQAPNPYAFSAENLDRGFQPYLIATQFEEAVASPVCFAPMGRIESGRDMRDVKTPGTKYFSSGCLIHGLSVVADSLVAVNRPFKAGDFKAEELLEALRKDFEGHEALHEFLMAQPKYGNNIDEVDSIAVRVASRISEMVAGSQNPAGRPFNPDFSTPSTHLLYDYWVGATPDGRRSRKMLGYGIDPRPGVAPRNILKAPKEYAPSGIYIMRIHGTFVNFLDLSPAIRQDIMQRLDESVA